MMNTILKRDGRKVPFNVIKIADAIEKAFKATGTATDTVTCQKLAAMVQEELEHDRQLKVPTVEEIQDVVEGVLIKNGYVRTAKAYILYRAERSRVREMNTRLMKIYEDITFSPAVDSDIKRENANIDGDTAMGAMLKYGSEGAKQFYRMFVLSPAHSKAHEEGDIHIHDLDFLTLTTTCCQIDLLSLFENGFSTGHGVLREPKDIMSYAALACIAIQSNQNDQHGGQSVPNFDYSMAPGVKKTYVKRYRSNLAKGISLLEGVSAKDADERANKIVNTLTAEGLEPSLSGGEAFNLRVRELVAGDNADKIAAFCDESSHSETNRITFQAMEAFIHNLNTMNSRAGAQTPFSSINYGMDTSPEGRMVVENILLATEAGLGNGETSIFPIQIFRVKDGVSFNQGDPNYDLFKLACRVSAKRLYPNFSFQDAPFNIGYYKEGCPETEIAYMGCRTRVIANAHDRDSEISYGRGNLSYTSINLPRIAIKAGKNIQFFFDELDRLMNLTIAQLNERFEIQARKQVFNYPFLMGNHVWLDSDKLVTEDEVRNVLKHGTLTIGFIGLAEALKALTGAHHGESATSQNLGLEIIGHMRARMDAETERTCMNYTLIATPAEGLSGRFVKMDRERFGVIPGVTDRDYYTNSFHVPVHYGISAVDKIRLEAPYHGLTNGGHISYIELDGDPAGNLEAFEAVVRFMQKSGIGYGSINHPVDRDPACGYNGIIGDACPKCGRVEGDGGLPFQRIRRITGYLVGTLNRFNNAKRAEERERVKHNAGLLGMNAARVEDIVDLGRLDYDVVYDNVMDNAMDITGTGAFE